MNNEEFIEKTKDVIEQCDEGAITPDECINYIFAQFQKLQDDETK